MRHFPAVLLAVLAVACSEEIQGIDCSEDSDCALGASCEARVCVDTTCDPACGAFHACWNAQCIVAFTRPVIEEPAAGATLLGGGKVTARLDRAVQGDSVGPSELELVATPMSGAPIETKLFRAGESLKYEGTLVAGEGSYALRAKLAGLGLESDPVTVEVKSCASYCGAYEECVASECLPAFSRLVFVELGELVLERPVHLRARIERAIAISAKEPPPEIEVTAQSGALAEPAKLTRVAGTDEYEGDWSVGADGQYSLVLRSEEAGVESAPATVTVDAESPSLLLEVFAPSRAPSADGLQTTETGEWASAHRRDEDADVLITCMDAGSGVDPSTVRLTVTGSPSGTIEVPVQPSVACAPEASCCFLAIVPLYDPELALQGFHGSFSMEATASDRAGRTCSSTKELLVTRWKWSNDLREGTIRVSPAIGREGEVYVGTANGKVFRVSPAGHSAAILETSGSITASPVVDTSSGNDTLFVAGKWGSTSSERCSAGTSGGALWQIDDAEGSSSSASCIYGAGNNIAAGISFGRIGFGSELPVTTIIGIASGSDPAIFAVPTRTTCPAKAFSLPFASGEDTGVALLGRQAFFGNSAGQVDSYELNAAGNWEQAAGWPVLVGNGNRPTSPIVTGAQRIAGGGGVGVGALFRAAADGQGLVVGSAASPTWNVINVTSDGESFLVASADGGSVFVLPEAFTASQLQEAFNLGATSSAGPTFGADKTLYFSTHASTLQARRISGELLWEAPLGDASFSAPALDCHRDTSGTAVSKPGTIYVGDDSGVLYAFVTDGHGLDYSSPWPKRHRDSQNTSDASRNLSALACP